MIILPVNDSDLVLEIGSGHNPHPRSNVLCDRYLYENTERQRQMIRYDRPMVIAAGEQLPFTDKAFDFVFCNQILEHTEDPERFLAEIRRVGKSGLIITPSVMRERMFGWSYHRWYFYKDKEQLYYLPKDQSEGTAFGGFMHRLFARSLSLRRHLAAYETELNHYWFWGGGKEVRRTKYEVRKQSVIVSMNKLKLNRSKEKKTVVLEQADQQVRAILANLEYSLASDFGYWLSQWPGRVRSRLQKLARQLVWTVRLAVQPTYALGTVTPLLECLECKKSLKIVNNTLVCIHCSEVYTFEKGIPILLSKKDIDKGY